jgi:DNA-binding transcriptional MerR regulator
MPSKAVYFLQCITLGGWRPVPEVTYSLKDLVALAAAAENLPLAERLARQYITDGLIAAPRTKGGGIAYSDEHLLQLRLVMRLASQYVHARDIQKFMGRLSPDGIRALVNGPAAPRLPSEGDANAYLTRLSRSVSTTLISPAYARDVPGALARPLGGTPRPRGLPAMDSPKGPANTQAVTALERTSWQRVVFDADIELHVRMRQGSESKRLLDALVAAIQDTLASERGTDV